MKRAVISAAAAFAVLGASAVVAQQAKEPAGNQPSAGGQMGQGQDMQKGRSDSPGQGQSGKSEASDEPSGKKKGADAKNGQQPKSSKTSPDGKSKAAEEPKASGKSKTAEPKAGDTSKSKTADQPKATDTSKSKTADQPKATDTSKSKTADQPKAGDTSKSKTADQPKAGDTSKKAADTSKSGAGNVQVTEQQRTTLRETIVRENVRPARVNISINIGTTVPRSVRLYALPVAFVSDIPAWRGYRYFVVEDSICIVDPQTYVIVEVIERRGGGTVASGGSRSKALELTAEERRIILRNVDMAKARSDVRISLALGAEVPRTVELVTFPEVIITEVPKVREYRYVVIGDDVAIIHPSNHAIVAVVRE